jgi:uncharacterized protein (DUF1684 family)
MRKACVRGWMLLLAAVLTPGLMGAADAPDAGWLKDLQGYRAFREAHISDPEGWLATVGLDWLSAGANPFGTAAGNKIKLEGGAGAAHLGVLVLNGKQVLLQPPAGGFSALLKEDGNAPKAGVLRTDEQPTKLTAGPLAMIVIERGGRFALRVRDSSAPARLRFKGLNWYPPDPRYRIEAKWVPYVPVHTLMIPTEIGIPDKMISPGVAEFTVDGRAYRLEPVLESPGSKQLFFILRDRTSSRESYGAGRFLYTDFPDHGLDQPGKLMLDFNRLENPACAFTAYATCPLPPRQNRLEVSLPVGEKKYHD